MTPGEPDRFLSRRSCARPPACGGLADARRPDAGRPDAGRRDARRRDARRPDAGRRDARRRDADRDQTTTAHTHPLDQRFSRLDAETVGIRSASSGHDKRRFIVAALVVDLALTFFRDTG
jgi:hypothetical protein